MNSLDGIRILDLTRVLAGPWCTQTLADLGADVIKIERPGIGDETRTWGPPFLKDENGNDTPDSCYYLAANRNKRSVTCDISTPEGQSIIRQLVAKSDVFIENFKVGDMARYGLDYAALSQINPQLVYCSITGFGQTGPYSDRPGYDFVVQGLGGLMSITGETDEAGGGPQKAGIAVADLFTGMYATVSILAALRHAEATGQGQYIDMALLDTQIAVIANLGANYLASGRSARYIPKRAGNAHQNLAPYQVFQVAPSNEGSNEHIILAIGNDAQFKKLCQVIQAHELNNDPRFATNADRVKNRTELTQCLAAIFKTKSKHEWLNVLDSARIPCGAINNLAETFADEQVTHRNMVDAWVHPCNPQLELVASPIHLSQTPVRKDLPPPLLGQHTHQVLNELLELDHRTLDDLKTQGII